MEHEEREEDVEMEDDDEGDEGQPHLRPRRDELKCKVSWEISID